MWACAIFLVRIVMATTMMAGKTEHTGNSRTMARVNNLRRLIIPKLNDSFRYERL